MSGPSEFSREVLNAGLEEIRAVIQAGEELERRDLREVLVPIGELILQGRAEEAEAALTRLRTALHGAEGRWEPIVEGELSLACAEHIQSADPRYMDLPNYDLDYARTARRQLAARLVAAERLGFSTSARLLAQVRRADRVLEERFGPPEGTGSGDPP